VTCLRTIIRDRPWTLVYSLTYALWAGPLATVAGHRVSSAFTIIGAGYLANAMGVIMIIGGGAALAGLIQRNHTAEGIGLVTMAVASALYALGVLLGLGFAGQVAGSLAIAAAVSMSAAAFNILSDAHTRALAEEVRE